MPNHRLRPLVLLAALLALPWTGASARPLQAPSSRVVLDLPEGYEAAALFSGFTNERNGVSIVVVEMPAKAYDELVVGMTPEALAAKGIQGARRQPLARPEPHLYIEGDQVSPSGSFAKFMLVFKDLETTALVSANVPKAAIDKGEITGKAVAEIMGSARIATEAAPATELFTLGDPGSFKPAARFLGSTRTYTRDGQLAPAEKSAARPVLIVAPSLDRRPVGKLDETSQALLSGIAGLGDIRIEQNRAVTIADLAGREIVARGRDGDSGTDITLYQVLLEADGGGYFRILGQGPAGEHDALVAEFRRIAKSFKPVPQK